MTRLLLLCGLVLTAQPSAGQVARLNECDPAMAISPSGRCGACDGLVFSATGDTLFACGDDKVVHRWSVKDGRLTYGEPLRWNTFREQRGSIYTLSVSPKGVAVGGLGRFTPDVSIIGLDGRVTAGLSPGRQSSSDYSRARSAVWAVGFDDTGDRVAIGHDDGSVWVWTPGTDEVRLVVKRSADVTVRESRILWVTLRKNRVLYARADGRVFGVDAAGAARPQELWTFGNAPLHGVMASGDGEWLVARPLMEAADQGTTKIEVARTADGTDRKTVSFATTEFPDTVTLDGPGRRLAVGLKQQVKNRQFFFWPPGRLDVYDLTTLDPKTKQPTRTQSAECRSATGDAYCPEAMAFHPTAPDVLAVAGGPDHETALWTITETSLERKNSHTGVGRGIWQLCVSPDGFEVGFRDSAATTPTDPNARGTGDWRVFDLKNRKWLNGPPPTQGPLRTAGGWTVALSQSDDGRWVVTDGQLKYPLPLDPLRDDKPLCYTFLPQRPGSDVTQLAVGHYWGYTLFEFARGEAPRRVRLAVGHAGPVTAIVPAAGGQMLVTASRDQTIALWSLEPWKFQPDLGANVRQVANQLTIGSVDPGSPAWEAGLVPGDEILGLTVDLKEVPRADWADALSGCQPGKEIVFQFDRAGQKMGRKTLLLQRPQWRFFPTAANDWVLYRYQDFYYDCSPNGDSYVGWLVGGKTAADSPTFHPAERFRKLFHQPEKIRDLMTRYARNPGEPFTPDILPPTLTVRVTSNRIVGNQTLDLNMTVTPRPKAENPGTFLPVEKVQVWLGDQDNADQLLQEFVPADPRSVVRPAPLTISGETLRVGVNRLVVVAYGYGVRAEQAVDVEYRPEVPREKTLRGLVVGINKYVRYKPLESAVADAQEVRASFEQLGQDRGFKTVTIQSLFDDAATPKAILAAVDQLVAESGPDDWAMVFLAGHGSGERTTELDATVKPGTWFYAAYAPDKNRDTADRVPGAVLFAKLAAAKGRKVVILDACHAGAAASDGVRDLRPDNKGPVVMSAAAPDEEAFEAAGRGFFSAGLTDGLNSPTADADGNGLLTLGELYQYTRSHVNQMVKRADKKRQTVQLSPNPLWGLPIAKPATKAEAKPSPAAKP